MLISRNYRGDVEMGLIDKFLPLLMEREEEGNVTPLIQTSGVTFMYVQQGNLYLVSMSRNNANAAMVFPFLHKLVQVWPLGRFLLPFRSFPTSHWLLAS